jgi:hypothetical protein
LPESKKQEHTADERGLTRIKKTGLPRSSKIQPITAMSAIMCDSGDSLFLRCLLPSVFQGFLLFNFGNLWQFWQFSDPRSSA